MAIFNSYVKLPEGNHSTRQLIPPGTIERVIQWGGSCAPTCPEGMGDLSLEVYTLR